MYVAAPNVLNTEFSYGFFRPGMYYSDRRQNSESFGRNFGLSWSVESGERPGFKPL